MNRAPLATALLLTACASSPATLPPAAAASPAAAGECTAELTTEAFARAHHGEAPDGWTATGKVVVEMKNGRPSRMELRDAAGKSVDTAEATGSNDEMRESVRQAACRLGGVLLMAPDKPSESDPRVTLVVLRPLAPNETADLKLMCGGPPDPLDKSSEFDPDQKRVIAAQIFAQSLTSPKWRGWLFDLKKQLRDAADRAPIYRAHAAELRAAQKDCWFATALDDR